MHDYGNIEYVPRPVVSFVRGKVIWKSLWLSLSRSAKRFSRALFCLAVVSPPAMPGILALRLRAPDGWIGALEGSYPVSGT